MHILVLPSNYPSSAQPNVAPFFRDHVRLLEEAKLKVGVLSIVPLQIKNWWRTSVKVEPFFTQVLFPALPKMPTATNLIRYQLAKYHLKKYIEKHGIPDVIHVHAYMAGKLAVWAKRLFGIPYVVTEHYSHFHTGTCTQWQYNLASEVYLHADKRIAVSSAFRTALVKMFNQEFEVIANPIDKSFEQRTNFPLKPEKARIVHVARLVPVKNQRLLLEAFSVVLITKPEAHLEIIGAGPLLNNLKKLAQRLNITKHVTFYGERDKSFVKRSLLEANVSVLSSKYETFGVVLIESLALGTPVVSTSVGGVHDIIENGENGLLCQESKESLANALIKVLDSSFDGEAISEKTKSKFGSQAIWERLRLVYTELCEKGVSDESH